MYAYGFVQCHVIGVTVHLCDFTAIDSVQREFTLQTLFVNNGNL